MREWGWLLAGIALVVAIGGGMVTGVIPHPAGPVAVRRNNPLNIRVGNDWQGEVAWADQPLTEKADPRFEYFQSPEYGFRAAAILLRNYQRNYGLRTLREIIHRWAPPGDNNHSDAYAEAVAAWVGVSPDMPVDLTRDRVLLVNVMIGMARFESGGDYFTVAQADAGARMAGIG